MESCALILCSVIATERPQARHLLQWDNLGSQDNQGSLRI
jgi:hypothetical protein